MRKDTNEFVTIRIRRRDHERLTRFVRYDMPIHFVITQALDLFLEKEGGGKNKNK